MSEESKAIIVLRGSEEIDACRRALLDNVDPVDLSGLSDTLLADLEALSTRASEEFDEPFQIDPLQAHRVLDALCQALHKVPPQEQGTCPERRILFGVSYEPVTVA